MATLLTAPGGASSGTQDSEQNSSPVGVWMHASERIQVEITPCGERFCGQIVWLSWLDNPQDMPLVDAKNPDPKLRTRPLVGLTVLRDLRRADAHSWQDGTIYNPADGRDYSALMSIEDDGRLRLRAYVLLPFFGETHLWSRMS